MKLLTITEYSREYHKTLRNIWVAEGNCKISRFQISWLEFKLRQYDFYLRECGCKLRFSGMEERLSSKDYDYDPDYTEEQLYKDIDTEIKFYNKHNTWIYRLLRRLQNTFQRRKKYAA